MIWVRRGPKTTRILFSRRLRLKNTIKCPIGQYGFIRRDLHQKASELSEVLNGISKQDGSLLNSIEPALNSCGDQKAPERVLETLSKTSQEFQNQVYKLALKENWSDVSLLVNIRFQHLLSNPRSDETLVFVLENIEKPLNHDLLEIFVGQNLHGSNLTSMTSLLRLIFHHQKAFTLSNELWSVYLSFVCEKSSVDGAKLVYHHLIDNHALFENYSAGNKTQTLFPFLVSPNGLSSLATIFQREMAPDYIIGLRTYFKRFYSLYGHKDSFRAISMSLVEAYSEKGDPSKALGAFKYLCMFYRGHQNFQSTQSALEAVYSMMNESNKWRLSNLETNTVRYPDWPEDLKSNIDISQEQFLQSNGVKIFDPIDAKSNTTRIVPVFPGSIQLNDLISFRLLMDKLVEKHMNSDAGNKIKTLVKLVENNHFMLSSFIVSSLASQGYLFEAFAVMKKTPSKYHDFMLPALYKEDIFLVVFKRCKTRLASLSSDEIYNFETLLELYQLIGEFIKFYFQVYGSCQNTMTSSKIMAAYISLIVDSPRFQTNLIEGYLNQYRQGGFVRIYLSGEDFAKLNDLYDLANSKYKDIICRELL